MIILNGVQLTSTLGGYVLVYNEKSGQPRTRSQKRDKLIDSEIVYDGVFIEVSGVQKN